ncbi:MAG: RtcB family protein, partial [Candidatus Accumulibacter meliphilus]
RLPFIFRHLAVMPDVHLGKGSTIGSVIPTRGAIIPAAVGVDIGCGMIATRSTLNAADLPDSLRGLRTAIEAAIPHGRTVGRGKRDQGSWQGAQHPPPLVDSLWARLLPGFKRIVEKYPRLQDSNHHQHLGTLGSGNHFIEVCLDEAGRVWFMLHSGSRGVGNAIGSTFIRLAQVDMRQHLANLPDRDLAYLEEGSRHFDDYLEAVGWAQEYARCNRMAMMSHVVAAARQVIARPFSVDAEAVNCHHNYVQQERHFGSEVFVTRKGALSARKGELGIIPGSMGARSYIVRGLGNAEAFCSCSHGAGRVMSRNEARRRFTVADQERATAHVECRKDQEVIDEIPMAYKDIDAVMHAQRSLVEVVHTLRQVVCVKG